MYRPPLRCDALRHPAGTPWGCELELAVVPRHDLAPPPRLSVRAGQLVALNGMLGAVQHRIDAERSARATAGPAADTAGGSPERRL